MNSAFLAVEIPGTVCELEVHAVTINRGIRPHLEYHVSLWAVSGGYRYPMPGGAEDLPPEVVLAAKRKLWEQLQPCLL